MSPVEVVPLNRVAKEAESEVSKSASTSAFLLFFTVKRLIPLPLPSYLVVVVEGLVVEVVVVVVVVEVEVDVEVDVEIEVDELLIGFKVVES